MVPIKLMEKIARDFDLTKEKLIEESLESEIRRRLAAYKFTDYILSKKYGLSFKEFEKKKIIAKKKYSFEVEQDYYNWDQSSDGIRTLEEDLKMLKKT